ncbi:MAG: hypothetical protein M1335_04260 [Chloroflexi bacterium]|nr:hypothetical protein [Chloroflexota bacterium]
MAKAGSDLAFTLEPMAVAVLIGAGLLLVTEIYKISAGPFSFAKRDARETRSTLG